MGRIYIDVEENPNCGYHPIQTFETQAPEREAAGLWLAGVPGKAGPHVVTGWCSDEGGSPCPVTVVEVTDSGAAVSVLVAGGDYGLRIKPEGGEAWSLADESQWGEPYMLLDPDASFRELESAV